MDKYKTAKSLNDIGLFVNCSERFDCLMSVSNKTTDSILIQLDKKLKSEIEQNCAKLKPIIETVMFCGRQGLPLRGHRDSGPIDYDNPPVENDDEVLNDFAKDSRKIRLL
ncbi:unnamed protein product [Macrosiphum euphorbiae]|uniref:DUF4371 domain-containing protein n=1 Tax=Macrosiphum euphorbiae TaxID=13131 RepID=A0AAV0YB48_9HEMI|nr:unnamed protein product [Macrosiphum euphorbiae]